jgi:ribosomal protein L40E
LLAVGVLPKPTICRTIEPPWITAASTIEAKKGAKPVVKKTIGYVELEWTCPSCGARNPGTQQTCQSCGAKMPDDIEFELPAQQEVDTSAETAARVAVGPDIHCPYCGARNPGNAVSCSQCGGDLSEGARRATGKVLGAHETGPVPDVTCPHCGASNPGTATKCSSCGGNLTRPTRVEAAAAPKVQRRALPVLPIIGLAVVLCLVAVGLFVFLGRTSEAVALVQDVEWSYVIQIEEWGPAEHQAWRDEVPNDARLGRCEPKEHHIQDEPAPNATEVCGTPYVVDTGTGKGEAVQDCEYHVYEDWCEYTIQEWRISDEEVATGYDLNPKWPDLMLTAAQRAGRRQEAYEVILDADGQDYVYRPADLQEFRQFQIGSKWIVETNALGGVTSVKPSD